MEMLLLVLAILVGLALITIAGAALIVWLIFRKGC